MSVLNLSIIISDVFGSSFDIGDMFWNMFYFGDVFGLQKRECCLILTFILVMFGIKFYFSDMIEFAF